MQALYSVLNLPFPPNMSVAILAVALLCSAVAIMFAHRPLNKALILLSSTAAIAFVFVGGHIMPPEVTAAIAGMKATIDSVAFGFLMLMPVFTILSVIKPSNNDGGGGVPPMG